MLALGFSFCTQDVTSLYSTLESLVFAQYVRRKTLVLNKVLKRGLMIGGISWSQARPPKGSKITLDHTIKSIQRGEL